MDGQIEFPEPSIKHICNYEHTKVYDSDVNPYFELKNLPRVQNPDGSIHMEFYVFAKRDVHVMFSDKKDVKVGEPCIQIVVGAENDTGNSILSRKSGYLMFHEYNSLVLNNTPVNPINVWINGNSIRSRRSEYAMFHEYNSLVLNKTLVNPINVWINALGEVKVTVNNHQFKYEMHPMPIKYVSFASWNQSPLDVFFNCTTQIPQKNYTLPELINESFHPNATGELSLREID